MLAYASKSLLINVSPSPFTLATITRKSTIVSSCVYKHIHTAPPTVSQHNSLHNTNTHLHVALHTTMPPPNLSQVHNPIIPTTPTTSIAITHHAKSNPLFPIIKRTVTSVANPLVSHVSLLQTTHLCSIVITHLIQVTDREC